MELVLAAEVLVGLGNAFVVDAQHVLVACGFGVHDRVRHHVASCGLRDVLRAEPAVVVLVGPLAGEAVVRLEDQRALRLAPRGRLPLDTRIRIEDRTATRQLAAEERAGHVERDELARLELLAGVLHRVDRRLFEVVPELHDLRIVLAPGELDHLGREPGLLLDARLPAAILPAFERAIPVVRRRDGPHRVEDERQVDAVDLRHVGERRRATAEAEREHGDLADLALILADLCDRDVVNLRGRDLVVVGAVTLIELEERRDSFVRASQPGQGAGLDAGQVTRAQHPALGGHEHAAQT
ncbi:hypothetical protein CPZ06_10255, partial [Lactobacillus acidophilus]